MGFAKSGSHTHFNDERLHFHAPTNQDKQREWDYFANMLKLLGISKVIISGAYYKMVPKSEFDLYDEPSVKQYIEHYPDAKTGEEILIPARCVGTTMRELAVRNISVFRSTVISPPCPS